MSKKNIFLLAAWYVAGWIISSLYNKKKPSELKKDLEKSKNKWEGEFKVMFDNFVATHSNLLKDLKSHVMTDDNKKLFNEKKEDLLKVVDTYKIQGLELADELKVKWKDFIVEASDSLEKLYEEKKEEIDALKDIAPEKLEELKDSAKDVYKEVKEKIKK